MTRVMQVMAGARHGGAEAFFMRLVPALSRAGVDQQAFIRSHPDRAEELRTAGIRTDEARFGGPFDLATGRAMARATEDFDPDVVLAWMNRAARFCRRGRHVLAARLGGYYDLKHYRACDHLIGNTADIRDYIVARGWPEHRAWHIPNFVDAAPATPAERAAFGTPDDAPLLLGLGRLHENKAFDVLIAAMAELPRVRLWIAGDGPLGSRLRTQAQRLGVEQRVRFLGWRRNVADLFAAADVLVCPSRHEPLGNVVIEAWAHSVPVVAARSQGPAALIDDRRSGLLVPVDDADALARAIRRVVEEPGLGRDLASAGLAAYQAQFTEAIVVRQYREFFERVTP